MAKEELFRVPLFGSLIRHFDAFPVRRNQRDESAVKAFHDFLHRDKPLVLFPEGTRTHDGELQVPKKGSGKLLYHARVPVLPVYLQGTYEAWSRHAQWPSRGRLKVVFGLPISLEDLYALPDEKETYRLIAERVMDRIRDLKTTHENRPSARA
jgi:1-acyl-sn-glycerol-3-phosphate acyltransferase